MGTSASNKGNRGSNPIIPSWVDPNKPSITIPNEPVKPDVPLNPNETVELPVPELPERPAEKDKKKINRYAAFRRYLTQFSKGKDPEVLRKAIRSYISVSLGGSHTAYGRFSSGLTAGGSLLNYVTRISPDSEKFFNNLEGHSPEDIINQLAEKVIPKNGDFDFIKQAIVYSLFSLLETNPDFFDKPLSNPSELSFLLESFISNLLSSQIINDAGDAINNSEVNVDLEGQIRSLVEIETHFSVQEVLAKKDISQLTVSDWNDLLKEIMKETLEILSKED